MSAELTTQQSIDSVLQGGIKFFQHEAWHEALACFDRVAEARPDSAEVHNYRARAFESLGRYEDALKCLDRALAINSSNAADLRNRGIVLKKLGRLPEALASYNAVLAIRPNDPDVLVKHALILNELDRREEALASVERAVACRPTDPDTLNARVIILDNLGRYGEALADADRMLAIQPDHVDAINNTGMLLARIGRFKDALTCYDRSLSIKPDQPQARYNRSLVRLALGDWIRGFQEFECRWNTAPLNRARLPGVGPLWSGQEDLLHKTLLLYHEQGYGDTLQCLRYVPPLAARGARVILAVPPALHSLVQSVPGVAQVLSGGEALPAHEYQCPLMSLPLAFRTTPDTVPAPVPYLYADPALTLKWQQRLGERTQPRIGLAWGGRRYAPINYPRDVPLAALRPLFDLNAQFIGLQTEMTEGDRPILARLPQLMLLGESLDDFADTAALIVNFDLVITVDTAVAHLAGALGKPVWLMNRYASCWRWLQHRDDSPWYPTLRQFRQPCVGDWTSVVSAVRDAAAAFLRSPAALPTPDALATRAPTATAPTPRPAHDKIRFVCASRLSREAFFARSPLGRSLPVYRTFPKRQTIELRLFANNSEGLAGLYNSAIEEARASPAILVFIHDDVYLSDYYWAEHLHDALESFDLVGLAGNRRRVPRQASWMYLDDQFTCDNYDNLSGVLGHGEPFPNLRQLSVYGEPGHAVKLLDGVMMAIRSQTLIERDLRFDPRFRFHFYDLDFCRQAELRQVRMGTWAISVVHASAGKLGGEDWRAAYRDYLSKYGET
jgi:tetratricopeptide (TPR) repeat protein